MASFKPQENLDDCFRNSFCFLAVLAMTVLSALFCISLSCFIMAADREG